MNDHITWAEPPEAKAGRRRRSPDESLKIATALSDHPGRWALVKTCGSRSGSQTWAANIKFGRDAAFLPAGTFEATVRNVDGQYRVFARRIPE